LLQYSKKVLNVSAGACLQNETFTITSGSEVIQAFYREERLRFAIRNKDFLSQTLESTDTLKYCEY